MINKILGTTGTRMLNAVFNLVILIVLTRELGSFGYGTITLTLLAITVLQLIVDLVAGSGIIYYTSRKPLTQLLFPAYAWIVLVLIAFFGISTFAQSINSKLFYLIIPQGYERHILFLTFLNAIMLTHYNLLIGQTRIKVYNFIFTTQISVLFISVLVHFYYWDQNSVMSFITSLYLSYFTGVVLSFFTILPKIQRLEIAGWTSTTKLVIKYGFTSQIANLLHIGNKRFSMWILKYLSGLSAVGIYGAGVQLTEGLRLIGQSISLVQFSSIASQDKAEYSRQLTIQLMKLSLAVTFMALLVLILIPSSLYIEIFKKDFSDIKTLILALSPGVMALAANTIFSGFFAGIGKPKISVLVNAIGFLVTLIAAWVLIPFFGYLGAAITASLSYLSTVISQYIIFKKYTGTVLSEWIPNKADIIGLMSIIRTTIHQFKKR